MESSSIAVRHNQHESISAQQPINDNSAPIATAKGNTKIKSRSIFKRVKNRLSKIRNGLGRSSKKPAAQTDTLSSSSPSPAFPTGWPRSIQERESERQSERQPSLQSSLQSKRHRSRPPSIASTAAGMSQEERTLYQSTTATQKEQSWEEKFDHGNSTSDENQEKKVSLQSQQTVWGPIGENDLSRYEKTGEEYKNLTAEMESMSKLMERLDPKQQVYLNVYNEYKVLEQRRSLLDFPGLKAIATPRAPASTQSAHIAKAQVIVEVKAAPSAHVHISRHGFATAEDLHKGQIKVNLDVHAGDCSVKEYIGRY